jgi:hypothetical protein
MSLLSHHPKFDYPNKIYGEAKIMQLLTMNVVPGFLQIPLY